MPWLKFTSRKVAYLIYLMHLKLSHQLPRSIISISFVIYRNTELKAIQSYKHEEMGKKHKAQGSEMKEKVKEMAPLYTDTACNRDVGISTWESMYRVM